MTLSMPALSVSLGIRHWRSSLQRVQRRLQMLSFNAAMSACDRGGQLHHVLTLMKDLQEARSLQLTIVSYSCAISDEAHVSGAANGSRLLLADVRANVVTSMVRK
ncbi:hypothetical protein AK812_SmicGene9231 [Symbiodinium microadriaticum]|uniref:Uncharacterized protein n=1 Tax=Symbiodinium microadriaticum TaxID=2951 RepID=A0A1Q9EJ62_SYMMI|nr:hypothetical protein AK812_SmicGene9231 [Symbiodinium microadriaticum]